MTDTQNSDGVPGAAFEVRRMREIARGWRGPHYRQIEGPNDLKIYGGTVADDIDRWADMITALEAHIAAEPDRMREVVERTRSLEKALGKLMEILSGASTVSQEQYAEAFNALTGIRAQEIKP